MGCGRRVGSSGRAGQASLLRPLAPGFAFCPRRRFALLPSALLPSSRVTAGHGLGWRLASRSKGRALAGRLLPCPRQRRLFRGRRATGGRPWRHRAWPVRGGRNMRRRPPPFGGRGRCRAVWRTNHGADGVSVLKRNQGRRRRAAGGDGDGDGVVAGDGDGNAGGATGSHSGAWMEMAQVSAAASCGRRRPAKMASRVPAAAQQPRGGGSRASVRRCVGAPVRRCAGASPRADAG